MFAVFAGKSRAEPHMQRFDLFGPLPKLIRDVLEKLRLYTGIDIDKKNGVNGANRARYSDARSRKPLSMHSRTVITSLTNRCGSIEKD